MDKKSKILLIFVAVVVLFLIGVTFDKYVVEKDYTIRAQIACDPKIESCFYVPCEGLDCPSEVEYYKLITKKAHNIELCDVANPECNPLFCAEGEEDCSITLCASDNTIEGEKCVDSVTFNNNFEQ